VFDEAREIDGECRCDSRLATPSPGCDPQLSDAFVWWSAVTRNTTKDCLFVAGEWQAKRRLQNGKPNLPRADIAERCTKQLAI
jgi:hypothetical protein